MIDIKCGDCMKLMDTIPNKSIDLILADLPYGTTRNKWDSVLPMEALWNCYNRIIKDNGAILLFSQMPFGAALIMSNPSMFRYEWIWRKSQGTGHLNANRMPLKIHENILVFYKHLPVYNPQFSEGAPYINSTNKYSSNYGKQKDNVITVNNGFRYPIDIVECRRKETDRHLHPTQKPVELLEYLIKTYTNVGGIVLDNCMGSGSTGVAAVNTNRDFIGYELDKEYFDIAYNRINKAVLDYAAD